MRVETNVAHGRNGAALLAAVVTGLLLTLTGAAAAAPPPDRPATCDIGTAVGRGTTTIDGRVVSFDFDVCETGPAATDTTGRYTPRGAHTGAGGTVGCADLNERTMAFLYTPDAGGPQGGQQVLVVVTDGGPNPGDDRIGFTDARAARDFPDGCGLGSGDAQAVTRKWQPLTEGDITVTLRAT